MMQKVVAICLIEAVPAVGTPSHIIQLNTIISTFNSIRAEEWRRMAIKIGIMLLFVK